MKSNSIFSLFLFICLILISCGKTEYLDNAPQLEIHVTNQQGQIVSGATVSLFSNEDDWKQSKGIIYLTQTNANGSALFEELEERNYYFLVEKEELNNKNEVAYFTDPLKTNVKAIINVIIR